MSLFGALNSSVTGLKAQSDALGIISDNISNVNTTGYKANQANFQSLVTSAPTRTSYNPGGVQLRPTQEVGQQGLLNASEINTDLAIEGNGMFAVKDAVGDVDGNELKYTRAGQFRVDEDGNMRNVNGFLLQGWRLEDDGNGNQVPPADKDNPGSLETVNVDGFSGIARATSNIELGANLPADLDVSETRQVTSRIFDAEGTPHNMKFEFTQNSGDGTKLPANQYRVDFHSPVLSDDPNSPQSGLFTLDNAMDLTLAPSAGGVDLGQGAANPLSGELVPGNLVQPSADIDQDGDGNFEARESIYNVSGTRVRVVDTDGGAAGANPNAVDIDATDGDLIEIDEDGDNQFTAGTDLRLFDSTDSGAATSFDQSSRISTVVEFQDGGIKAIGTDALNANLTGSANNDATGGVPGTTINADDSGRLDLGLSFASTFAATGGTDTTRPTSISLNVGTPTDVDLDGDGALSAGEQGVNDFQTDGLQSYENSPDFQLNELEQDGLQFGDFTGVDIGEDGIVTAQFSNGERREVFQIPIVTFNNPNGLEGQTGTIFSETPESGEALLNEAGIGGAGSIAPAALESSTVDLATEFTKMIETQRAYSASTRVVTTSDEMLQEITNATR